MIVIPFRCMTFAIDRVYFEAIIFCQQLLSYSLLNFQLPCCCFITIFLVSTLANLNYEFLSTTQIFIVLCSQCFISNLLFSFAIADYFYLHFINFFLLFAIANLITDTVFLIFETENRPTTIFIFIIVNFQFAISIYPNLILSSCLLFSTRYLMHANHLVCLGVILFIFANLKYLLASSQSYLSVNQYFFADFNSSS